jgi:hypothetical protein
LLRWVAHVQGAAVALDALDGPHGTGIQLTLDRTPQDQGGIGVADVPLGAKRARNPWRGLRALRGRFDKRQICGDGAAVTCTAGWAPTANRKTACLRRSKGGLIDAGLAARDDLGQHAYSLVQRLPNITWAPVRLVRTAGRYDCACRPSPACRVPKLDRATSETLHAASRW